MSAFRDGIRELHISTETAQPGGVCAARLGGTSALGIKPEKNWAFVRDVLYPTKPTERMRAWDFHLQFDKRGARRTAVATGMSQRAPVVFGDAPCPERVDRRMSQIGTR